ncbi:hypothetical protein WME90_40915 [Sorangium sp. So ce375]|uniref:hypothetical protein n=1 Tax=Sorangium sp. So ce375 TaxID=3133306 RepID=UPI003F5C5D2E
MREDMSASIERFDVAVDANATSRPAIEGDRPPLAKWVLTADLTVRGAIKSAPSGLLP